MKNKTKGILLLTVPIITLFLTLSFWAVSKFVIANKLQQEAQNSSQTIMQDEVFDTQAVTELAHSDLRTTATQIINVVLGLLGILAVLGIMIGTPLGIYFLAKNEEAKNLPPQSPEMQEKYKNLTPEQIAYINKWSWAAFFAFPVWVLGNGLYIWVLAMFIPIFNLYAVFKLAIQGRKMAWEQEEWQNFDQFKQRQKIMAWIVFAFSILVAVSEFV